MNQEEKLAFAKILRQETGCGLMMASVAIDKLINALKNRPLPIMDKPSHLKITWEG